MSPKPIQKLKPYFKPRPRKGKAAAPGPPVAVAPGAPAPVQPAAAVAPAPPASGAAVIDRAALGRRRDQLARQYAEFQSELGGLVYEMAIRDHFRLDLVTRQAARLQALDAELTAVDRQLAGVPPASGSSCRACGATLQPGAGFCGRCGAPVAAAQPPTAPQPSASPPQSPTGAPAPPTVIAQPAGVPVPPPQPVSASPPGGAR